MKVQQLPIKLFFCIFVTLFSNKVLANSNSTHTSESLNLCEASLIKSITSEIQLPKEFRSLPIQQKLDRVSEWLANNLIEIFETQPIQSNNHVVEFMRFRKDLLAGKFLEESPRVVSSSSYGITLEMEFYIQNSLNPELRYSAVADMAFIFSTDENGLILLSSYKEVRGYNYGLGDWKNRLERAKFSKRDFVNSFIQNQHSLDASESYPWVHYQREVLNQQIIPLALKDPSVLEVGIGFSRNQRPNHKGWEVSLPNIIIGRNSSSSNNSAAEAPRELLPSSPDRPISFSGVDVFLEYLDERQFKSVNIPDRMRYLVVYDEMRDQNPSGITYAIHRETGETHRLYYHPKTQDYKLFQPIGDQLTPPTNEVQKFNPYKTSARMIQRFENLEGSGFNPRVRVRIYWNNSDMEESILFVSDIRDLTLRLDVEKVVESMDLPSY